MHTRQAVVRLSAFFLLLCLAMVAVDLAINSGLRNIRTSSFGVMNRIVTGQINAEIVISGSSRALTHYDPRIIEQATGRTAFNIGLNGSQTDMQLACLQAYLKHNQKPKLVIQNLDLFSLLTSHEIYDPAQYLPYLNEESIYAGVHRVYPDAWKWKYLPLYGYAVEDMRFTWIIGLEALMGIQPKEDHFQGFLPRHTRWTEDFEKFREKNPDGVRVEIEPQGVRDLAEVGETCRRLGVPLVFVYSPEYDQMQALERNRNEIFAKFQEICDRFAIPLWDYSNSAISRNRENFYNSQHLNYNGAKSFSRELAERLVYARVMAAKPTPIGAAGFGTQGTQGAPIIQSIEHKDAF